MRTAAALVAAGSLLLATPASAARTPASATEARGTAVAAARAASEGIGFGPCAEEQELPPTVECGTLRVPLDYARPDGERIPLTVSRSRATGQDPATGRAVPRQGSLVDNPGGPGVSGMYFPMLGMAPDWKRLAAAYDLVGYAPRGVGRSAPLSCTDPKTFQQGPAPAPQHPSARVKRERAARAEAYARGCAERSGDALRHYTSLNNARDLDVLRAALGETRLTFLGSSYGTYIGALYATLFPSHVRRMVFDSAVNPAPERIWYRNNLAQSAAFEDRWADFRAWVARHHGVYGLGGTPGEVRDSYDLVRERLARTPAGGKVGPAQLHAAMLKAAYYDDHWPQRAHALSAYLKGDPGPLVEQAEEHPEAAAEAENTRAVYLAVECNDAPWPADFAVWDRDNTRLARRAPFETWDNVWTNLPCAFWPAPRQHPLDVRAGAGALPPTLILAAERDAATPYDGALELHRRLAGSALVTERDAGSHGLAGGANACVTAYLTAYLLEGRVPGRRASCAPHPAPEPTAPAT
ncbi:MULTISPECIES: alpha/beta hydrolase [Streptomyces]|uniref:Protease n=1 Tax=Streptomyces pseudogriseolus TaxID=36817 RepID=A0ABQ2SIQ3_STREZ|nr:MULTISPECIES: alpha/beta hydrolase [Streptomyces]GGS28536.1 protease [Streptomyces rubiginosus]